MIISKSQNNWRITDKNHLVNGLNKHYSNIAKNQNIFYLDNERNLFFTPSNFAVLDLMINSFETNTVEGIEDITVKALKYVKYKKLSPQPHIPKL